MEPSGTSFIHLRKLIHDSSRSLRGVHELFWSPAEFSSAAGDGGRELSCLAADLPASQHSMTAVFSPSASLGTFSQVKAECELLI